MNEKKKQGEGKQFFKDAAEKLSSANSTIVLRKLSELKSTGNVTILRLILDLLSKSQPDAVIREVIAFIGQLKDQHGAQTVAEFVQSGKAGKSQSELISACWQSGLDFSNYLTIFADSFVSGNYQIALESFTVIEETLWKATEGMILECKQYLIDRQEKINTEKQLLYKELLKVLDEGTSHNAEDYPEFFKR
jgi:hypothetical protein